MILCEILGLPREHRKNMTGYGNGDYNRRSSRKEGRPTGSTNGKLKPRPNKNIWYTDDKMWYADLDLYNEPGSLKLISDENEENIVVAVDRETGKKVFGRWDAKKKRGITFKTPKMFNHVAPYKVTFKDFVIK